MATNLSFRIPQGFLYLGITTLDLIALGNNCLDTAAQALQFFGLGSTFRIGELGKQRRQEQKAKKNRDQLIGYRFSSRHGKG